VRALDRWREIFASLARRRLRTALTALSVAWGIFMLVILLAAGNGLANAAENAFRDDAANSVWLFPSRTTKAFEGRPKGQRINMTNDDYELLKGTVNVADHMAARYLPRGSIMASRGSFQGTFPVKAVHPDHQFLERTTISEGRYINEADLVDRRKVAIVGRKVVKVLFPHGEDNKALGGDIRVGRTTFRIVGIFDDKGDQGEQETIYIPISTGQLVYAGTNAIDQLMFTVGDTSVPETERVVKDVKGVLARKHGFDPTDTGGIHIRNNHLMHEKMQGVLWAIRSFVWLIGLGTILAGVVGVGNIMLISVKERTKEFGVRKALGATPWSIVLMVLEEALVITTASGYMGLVAAVAVVEAAAALVPEDSTFFKNPEVDIGVGLSATVILVVAGLLAGLWPARRAARVHPVEAFRAEA
jgi:putative ABC transport system permease protein